MSNITLNLINRNSEEGKKIHRDFLDNAEIGSTYFKCIIAPYELGCDSEYWGHCYSDLKTAKKYFMHDIDADLDGDLDYGFMSICVFEVQVDENGKRYGLNTRKRYVNNFGHWEDEETFLKNRYGYSHQDYIELLERRFAK